MHLRNLQTGWETLAQQDAMWAILTDPEKEGNKWNPREFFETGRSDIRNLMAYLDRLQLKQALGTALDFGCGVGRLTQALCEHFPRVYGVDISPTMIDLARRFNQFGERCSYLLNSSRHLKTFGDQSVDFVYTVITLQHIPAHIQRSYLKEFFRVLRPTGVAVFRTLASTSLWRFVPPRVWDALRIAKHQGRPFMGAYGLSIISVVNLIEREGCRLVELQASPCPSPNPRRWLATQFCVQKI